MYCAQGWVRFWWQILAAIGRICLVLLLQKAYNVLGRVSQSMAKGVGWMERLFALDRIVENMEKVIIDKQEAIELTLVTLLCKGHILIEDIPGVGKTSLAAALAKSLDCSFKRIQFTPDIMPSDITGFSIFNPKTGDFEYRSGAILSQVVLADEINRTSPKTQSSLLEAMEEKQVTVDGITHAIPQPFIVLATQNPIEYMGTYPLPEAQMDRFFMCISLGYPGKQEEMRMITRFGKESPLHSLQPVANSKEILQLQRMVEDVHVDPRINEYIVEIVHHTRNNPYVALGASPRASISLYKAGQAWAFYNRRNYVLPDDIIHMCRHVLAHRIMLKQESRLEKIDATDIVQMALDSVRVPSVEGW